MSTDEKPSFSHLEQYRPSGWTEKWDHFLELYGDDLKRLNSRLCKERYRQTEKGKAQRRRESRKYREGHKYYEKKKAVKTA